MPVTSEASVLPAAGEYWCNLSSSEQEAFGLGRVLSDLAGGHDEGGQSMQSLDMCDLPPSSQRKRN